MLPMMFTERRTKMRWPKIGLFLLALLFLPAIPLTVEALEVRFCVPDCATDLTPQIRGPGTPSTVSNVTTTTVTIASFIYKGFTISGRAVSQQSGTLQKITFNPTAITANTTSLCNTLATNPCRLEIIATSAAADFPALKPTGGYPAGLFMAGFFTGTEPAHTSPPNPNGDTVSMTGDSSGLSSDSATAINSDVINATPGAGTGDTLVSLPSSCTGSPACKFIATSALKSFNTQISETVQQRCQGTATTCRTRLRARVSINIKRAGNRLNLPAGAVTVDSEAAGTNTVDLLIAETLPPFENLNVNALRVFGNIKTFELDGGFTLDTGSGIDPANEEVYLKVGQFGMTIPPGKFKRFLEGKLFAFIGNVDGLNVAATFKRGTNPLKWTFAVGVVGVNLTGLLPPAAQVPVDLAVGSDTGSDLVMACFSKGCFPLRH